MPRQYDHLALDAVTGALPRPRRQGGSAFRRSGVATHGAALLDQADTVADSLAERLRLAPTAINPRLIFKLQLVEGGNVDEANLSSVGLRLLARTPGKAVVVFPDEATLRRLREHLHTYADQDDHGRHYRFLDSVESIAELTADDRTGPVLTQNPVAQGSTEFLDLELYRPDDTEQAWRWVQEIEGLATQDGRANVTDVYVGSTLCLLRVRCSPALVRQFLQVDYVKQLERRPLASFERVDIDYFELGEGGPVLGIDVPEDLAGIVVVDSGVAQGHPLLGPVLGDAQAFGDPAGHIGSAGPEDVDGVLPGHGTAVAGIAVYGRLLDGVTGGRFIPTARLYSARVTNDRGEYDENELLETQLSTAVDYFLEHYPHAHVFNLSLGNADRVYGGDYQFRLAALLDELAYKHREKEVLFVVSTGNYLPSDLTAEQILTQYPDYLTRSDSHILDPATASIGLTVGGLSAGAAAVDRPTRPGIERPVAGVAGYPSPFTRTGPGIGGAVKPEVVDDAGDSRFERRYIATTPNYAGIPTTSSAFAPPDGRLLKLVAGTSFAAPKVANLAARLFREFPGATSNLIRALIAESAAVPDARPPSLAPYSPDSPEILNLYGYGQPDFDRARWSAENCVVLAVEDRLPLDSYRIYEVPALPAEFFDGRGPGFLRVVLAFDPPTRHTRADSYLGVAMHARLLRNTTAAAITRVMQALSPVERAALSEGEDPPALHRLRGADGGPTGIGLRPGPRVREKGTLQRSAARVSNHGWRYDDGPLHLLVVAQRKWAPVDVAQQRFAAIVSVSQTDQTADLYARMRARSRVFARMRARV